MKQVIESPLFSNCHLIQINITSFVEKIPPRISVFRFTCFCTAFVEQSIRIGSPCEIYIK